MTKLLSIIIPVYNEAPFVRRCLESVSCINNAVEVIVIDDASTDGSRKIAEEYCDLMKFKFEHHTTNWGVSMTRNHGMTLASGKYIAFLDSDDEMSEEGIFNMLEAITTVNQIPNLEERPVIQFNHYRYYHRTDKMVTKYKNPSGSYYYDNLPKMWCMVWNKMYLRSFIEDNYIRFRAGLQYGEDELFNLKCLKYSPTIYCSDLITTIKHFENQNSICHTLNKEKLLSQTEALVDLLKQDNSLVFDAMVRNVIADHWNSETYNKYIGGEL